MKKFLLYAALCCFCSAQALAQFTKVLTGPHVTDGKSSYGASWIDYDNDGDDDLFVAVSLDGATEDLLYQNNGNGTFTKIVTGPLVTEAGTSRGSTWGDYDNDGYVDGFVVNQGTTSLFKNESFSSTEFIKIATLPTTSQSFDNDHSGAAWGDYDNDGDLDLFLSNFALTDVSKNVLYEKVSNGFEERANPVINEKSAGQDPSWIDFDDNGTLDLFVPNYMAQTLFVYRNDGNKTFTKLSAGMPAQFASPTVGMSWADYDNDGDFDVALAVNVNAANYLYENKGDGTFSPASTAFTTIKSSAMSWADFDNDGNIDIVCSGGDGDKTYLFRNNGNKTFTDVSTQYGVTNVNYSWGAATADYDKDGFVDIFIANASGNNRSTDDILYHNNGNANRWISVKLKGVTTNRSAIGANVSVFTGNKQQKRTVQSLTGRGSQNSLNAHFGLAGNNIVDSLVVEWPLKGYQILTDIPSNQFITVEEVTFPQRPTGLVGENVELETITLNWADDASNETGFIIQRSKGDKSNFKLYAEVGANVTTFTDVHAEVRTIYFYRVFAKNANGVSLPSGIAEIKSIILEAESELAKFSVYPNPVTDHLNIAGANAHDQFELKTILGQTVRRVAPGESNGRILVDDLPAGVYILTNKRQSVKVIKSK